MDEKTEKTYQYVVKVYVAGHSFPIGPFSNLEDAERMHKDIAYGDVDKAFTQKGSPVIFPNVPDAVELVRFEMKG